MKINKTFYISLANVIAAFAMVMLHTNNCFWEFNKERYWITANIIESVMYFAVPIFFMISGATLIDYKKRYSTKEYLTKRVTKTVIPFLIWSLIGVVWAISEGEYTVSFDLNGLKTIIKDVINTSVVGIYWFFIPLFRIYLLIPLIACIKEQDRKKIFVPLSFFLFVFDYVLCYIGTASTIHRTESDKICLYISYVLVGYLIHKYDMSKSCRRIIYVLGLIGLALHICMTQVLSYDVGYIVQTWKGYANIPCVLYSVAVFVWIKQIGGSIKNHKLISAILFVSQYTFAIYLIHWYIIDYAVELFAIETKSILYRIGMPFVLLPICIGITWLVRKIPVLRRILP